MRAWIGSCIVLRGLRGGEFAPLSVSTGYLSDARGHRVKLILATRAFSWLEERNGHFRVPRSDARPPPAERCALRTWLGLRPHVWQGLDMYRQ